MNASVKLVPVQAAYDDLLQRSLSKLSCDLARLVYLASTRDYNSGTYHHDGLAARFRADAASKALEIAHRQIFYQLSAYSLEELVAELELYLNSSHECPTDRSPSVGVCSERARMPLWPVPTVCARDLR